MTDSPLHIHVDFDRCEGHGLCVYSAPDIFDLSDDGELKVLTETVPPGQEQEANEAVRACPVAALDVSADSVARTSPPNRAALSGKRAADTE